MRIERDRYLKELISLKHIGMIKVITGLRRCGKSYLLFNLFCDHLKKSGVDDRHIIKVDLEDRRNIKLRQPDELLNYIDSRIKDDKMHYILLDEVQHVAEFEDVLNSYLKVRNADVYVTGSNSKFLSKDVITEFRGRGFEVKVYPLSFSEFVTAFKGTQQEALEEYLTYGGLPELLNFKNAEQKADYLKSLFETTYLTDIKARYNIENDSELGELINVIASSIGSLINPTRIENTFKSVEKVSMSRQKINNYLEILEEAFLVEKSSRYNIKGRRYIGTPSKYYFTDVGLRNARLNFRQNEATHLMENVIYNELRSRGMSVDVGVVTENCKDENGASKRNQLEVDFVCNQGSKRCYIQSAYRLPTDEKREQELRPLNKVGDNFSKFTITDDLIRKYQNDDGVVIMNIFEFLLNENSLTI